MTLTLKQPFTGWRIVIVFLLLGHALTAQPVRTQPQDTAVFSLNDLSALMLANHPIIRQANLLSEEARQEVMQARGGFDPKLASGFDRKQFGNPDDAKSLYYNKWANELKVPVWWGGADLKVTYDRFVGQAVNPETRTSNSGLAGVGLSIPLGQGLLIDARRATLKQAQTMLTAAEAERVKQINKVWFSAAKEYWTWYLAYQQVTFLREGFDLADTRFLAVSRRAQIGDAAAVDSVEAKITAQDRQVQLEQALVSLQNAKLMLSTYLWNDSSQPLELPDRAVPQPPAEGVVKADAFQQLLARAADQHPELLKLDAKVQQLAIEERFRRELLKPQINVTGTLLSQPPLFATQGPAYYDFSLNNYKVGVDFLFPLFLRKERGKLKQVQIKAQQTTLERTQTNRDIQNGVQAAYNDLLALERQIQIQQQSVRNQVVLVRAEQQKFDMGESSLFLVNTRESKLIDMQIKLAELRSKYQKAVAELYYTAGTRG